MRCTFSDEFMIARKASRNFLLIFVHCLLETHSTTRAKFFHYSMRIPRSDFTPMFIERMKVSEYHQKFAVKSNIFSGSNNTKTLRKMVFSLTCACMCVFVC